jgi:hypothetical protein
MENDFDRLCRFLSKRLPAPLLAWLLRLTEPELGFLAWLDTQNVPYFGSPDRRCDTLARLAPRREHGRPWAILIEFQTKPDFDMAFRIGRYLCDVGQTLLPSPLPGDRFALGAVLVHLTGTSPVAHVSQWPEADTELVIRLRVVNLAALVARRVLAEIATQQTPWVVLGWIPLMVGGTDAEVVELWKQVANEAPEGLRADLADAARTFAELTDCRSQWVNGLKGWNVMRSQLANEWRAEGRDEGRKEGRDEGRKDGIVNAYQMLCKLGMADAVARQTVVGQFGPQADAVIAAWLEQTAAK